MLLSKRTEQPERLRGVFFLRDASWRCAFHDDDQSCCDRNERDAAFDAWIAGHGDRSVAILDSSQDFGLYRGDPSVAQNKVFISRLNDRLLFHHGHNFIRTLRSLGKMDRRDRIAHKAAETAPLG